MKKEKLNFLGTWKDDRNRIIEVTTENQYGFSGHIIHNGQRLTKVMYDPYTGTNKMDGSKLMIKRRGQERFE